MILLKNKKSIYIPFLLILFFCECKKTEVVKSPEDFYTSTNGGVIKTAFGNYEIIIPANALLSNQYIKEKVNKSVSKLILDSTFSFGPISEVISFACYNCNSLQIAGTMKLGLSGSYSTYFNLPKVKPYYIDNTKNISDFNNWEEIPLFTKDINSEKITFQFTDLTKTYFIGWSSN